MHLRAVQNENSRKYKKRVENREQQKKILKFLFIYLLILTTHTKLVKYITLL